MRETGDILYAAFTRLTDGGWRIDLRTNLGKLDALVRPSLPAEPDRLFDWILDRGKHDALRRGTWRLRVHPETMGPSPSPMPPILCWPRLLIEKRSSVFLRGWTFAMLHEAPLERAWPAHGSVAIIGDDSLANKLTGYGYPGVRSVGDLSTIPDGSIVVVPSLSEGISIRDVQAEVSERSCPLVIWCGTEQPAPHPDLLEIVPTGEKLPSTDSLDRWLDRLLGELLSGTDPEHALARSMSRGPVGLCDAWMLRGTLRPWEVKLAADLRDRLHFRLWRHEVDRRLQTGDRDEALKGLFLPSPRRAHVLVFSGSQHAGLDFFRMRPFPLLDVPGLRVVSCEPEWREPLRETDDAVCQCFGAKGFDQLVRSWRAAASNSSMLLVHINHEIRSLAEDDIAEAGAYLDKLVGLAERLSADANIRVFVCIYVLTKDETPPVRLAPSTRSTAMALTRVKPLSDRVDAKEIDDFLFYRSIELNDDTRLELAEKLSGYTFLDMVNYLTRRYPHKLRPA